MSTPDVTLSANCMRIGFFDCRNEDKPSVVSNAKHGIRLFPEARELVAHHG